MSSEPVILLQDVVVHRGTFCLKIPNLQINSGERVGIVAPSGQGKSTLLLLLAGLIAPSQGLVQVHGVSPSCQPAAWRARNIAWMGSDLELPTDLRVQEQVALAAYLMNQAAPSSDQVESTLQKLGIGGFALRTMSSLSTGQQQRVALARMLLHPAPLRLADEPTASMDEGWASACTNLLLSRPEDLTVCFASHDPTLIDQADRVITPEGSVR